jgi:hypothetical protein
MSKEKSNLGNNVEKIVQDNNNDNAQKIFIFYGLERSIESGFFFFLFIPNFSKIESSIITI